MALNYREAQLLSHTFLLFFFYYRLFIHMNDKETTTELNTFFDNSDYILNYTQY